MSNRAKQVSRGDIYGAAVVEFFGGIVLVGAGLMAAIHSPAGSPWAAIAFGTALFLCAVVLGSHSGAHLNWGVTTGVAIFDGVVRKAIVPYFIASLAASTLVAWVIRITHDHSAVTKYALGAALPAPGVTFWGASLAEGLAMFVFVFVVLECTTNEAVPKSAGLIAIGLTLGAVIYAASFFSGGAVNPGRELGPLLVSGKLFERGFSGMFYYIGIYVIAPLFGAFFGVLACAFVGDVKPPKA